MAAIRNSTHNATHAGSHDQAPAVLNIRRPGGLTSEIHQPAAPPAPEGRELDDAPLPQTALRLPDLAAIVKRLPKRAAASASISSIAQWTGIVLGALLALWLIFGGQGSSTSQLDSDSTPAAAPPVYNPPPLAPDAPEAPRWQPPAVETPSAPAEPANTAPASAAPADTAPAQPDATPSHEVNAPELPAWDAGAHQTTPPPATTTPATTTAVTPDRQPVYTAQRQYSNQPAGPAEAPPSRYAQPDATQSPTAQPPAAQPAAAPAPGVQPPSSPSDVPPLGITVPVPQ